MTDNFEFDGLWLRMWFRAKACSSSLALIFAVSIQIALMAEMLLLPAFRRF